MLADTPSPHGSGAPLASVGTFSEGFERSVASPLLPRRLRAMGCAVWSILHAKQSFLAALQVAACDGTHGLISSSLPDNHSNSFSGRSLPCLVGRLVKFSRVKHQREVSLLSHSVMLFLLPTQPTSAPLQSGLRFLSHLIPASPSVRLTASLPLAGSDTGLPCFVKMTR